MVISCQQSSQSFTLEVLLSKILFLFQAKEKFELNSERIKYHTLSLKKEIMLVEELPI